VSFLIFTLLCAIVALLFMTSGLRARLDKLDNTLNDIAKRLDTLSFALTGTRPAEAGVAPAIAEPAAEPEPTEPQVTLERRTDETISAPVTELPPETFAPSEPPVADAPEEMPVDEPVAERPRRGLADLEQRFGTQWVVWVGGLALALGGIFLVRYSIEQGLFGPGLRIAMGAVLALVLVGLGELARRREIIAGLAVPRAHIPSILTAAGTTVAYADVWAAHALYDFLSPGIAFVLLGLVALATLAAALVHGPALGGLGLIGAYVTPMLVSSAQPSYWALYVYLGIVTAAAYALARMRMWRWLAITAAIFSILWMLPGLPNPGAVYPHAFHALAGFALAAIFIVPGLIYGPPAEHGRIDKVSSGILAGYLFGAFLLVLATRHGVPSLTTLFALAGATIAIAWRSESTTANVPFAALLATLVAVHWAVVRYYDVSIAGGVLLLAPELLGSHLAFGAGIAVLFGAAGYLAQGRSEQPLFSIVWAATGVLTPIVILIAVYSRVAEFERSLPFAFIALLLAALFGTATEMLGKREARPGIAGAGAVYACGAVAGLALALTFALDKGWLTVSLALMVPGIAWISNRRPLPMLRQLCMILALLVLARVVWDPRIVGADVGTTPILNWILYGYGVPALAFWIGGHLLRRRADDMAARSVESAAITFTALTAFLEIRHLMNDGDIYAPAAGLGEIGLQVSTGLAMAIGLERVRARTGSIIHDIAACIIAALTFAAILFGLFIGENPMLTGDPVGGPIFNYILLGYGIPALLMGVLARVVRNTRPRFYYVSAAITAIVLALAYLSLEVRTLFQGPVLTTGLMSDAEDYAYSAVWLAFGVVLLIGGFALRSQPARLASAAVVILTIGKVFLHDLAGVQGIYRAFSLTGLGLVLMGIGWLYQRRLFPSRRADDPVSDDIASPRR
jgi:uncharacterized membrane protein